MWREGYADYTNKFNVFSEVIYVALQWQQDTRYLFGLWKMQNPDNPPVTVVPGCIRKLYNKRAKRMEDALIVAIAGKQSITDMNFQS